MAYQRFSKSPTLWKLEPLIRCTIRGVVVQLKDGRYVASRPEGFSGWRNHLSAAWAVFTGRADAVVWPETDDS